jgi:L-malate glycosyltransferase
MPLRKRVVVFVKIVPNKRGSMEDWIVSFARLASADFSVTVATYSPCHADFSEELRKIGVAWVDLASLETSFLDARNWLGQHADICHFSLFAPRDTVVLASQTIGRMKVIFQDCFSSPTVAENSSSLSKAADRITFLRTRYVVGVSEYVSNRLRSRFGVQPEKLRTIYNGVSPARFSGPFAEDAHLVVCVAALIPEKGVETLIRAFGDSRLTGNRLEIVGDGPQRPALEALAAELGLRDRVHFVGMQSDVELRMGRAAVVVHPALWGEAFGLTIAEAMFASKAIVASRVGAIPELLGEGECGLLTAPGDSEGLVVAIVNLLSSVDRRRELGQAAAKRANLLFTMEQWAANHHRLLLED